MAHTASLRLLALLACALAVSAQDGTLAWRLSNGQQDCPITCGNNVALQTAPVGSGNSEVRSSACAVNGTFGTQLGTVFFNQNTRACWVYTESNAGATSRAYSSWYCLCFDRSAAPRNATGDATKTCADTCQPQSTYNTSITSCRQPTSQSLCYDGVQHAFGYQPSSGSDQDCLLVQPPATTTAQTLQTQRSTAFDCVCTTPQSGTGLQIASNCSSVPYAASTPTPAPPGPPGATSSKLSSGAIAGIAVGAAVGVAAIAAALFLFVRRRNSPGEAGGRGKDDGSVLWDDDPEKQGAFFGSDQFNTFSSDLEAFDAVHGKNTKNSQGTDTSGMTTGNTQTTSPSTKDMDSSSDMPTGDMPVTGGSSQIPSMPSTGQSFEGSSKNLANIIELQEEQDMAAVELPFPQARPDGGVDPQIAKILMDDSLANETQRSESQNHKLEEVGLTATWKIEPQDLHCRMKNGKPMLLGEGGYGKVYRGVLNKTDVAVKVVTSHDPDQQSKFVQEIVTLRACHNTHIVQFLGACIREQQTFMVMEFMPCGDLFSRIDRDTTGKFGWYRLGSRVAMDVCKGLSYLHSKSIAHLDLKSPNVLLTSNFTAKIGDVGLGKIISNRQAAATRQGSLFWAAPEQLLGTECSTKSDMFSFGTVLWEICSGERPVNRQTRPLRVPDEAPQEIQDIITRCHYGEPDRRPTADEVYDLMRAAARRPPT